MDRGYCRHPNISIATHSCLSTLVSSLNSRFESGAATLKPSSAYGPRPDRRRRLVTVSNRLLSCLYLKFTEHRFPHDFLRHTASHRSWIGYESQRSENHRYMNTDEHRYSTTHHSGSVPGRTPLRTASKISRTRSSGTSTVRPSAIAQPRTSAGWIGSFVLRPLVIVRHTPSSSSVITRPILYAVGHVVGGRSISRGFSRTRRSMQSGMYG